MRKALVQPFGPVWAIGDTKDDCEAQLQGYGDLMEWQRVELLLVDCTDALADAVEFQGGDLDYEIDLTAHVAYLDEDDVWPSGQQRSIWAADTVAGDRRWIG